MVKVKTISDLIMTLSNCCNCVMGRFQDLYGKLYPHQKESLLWFWGLHKKKAGGILADDMG